MKKTNNINKISKDLGFRLKQLRELHKLTLNDALAQMELSGLNISKTSLNRYENGKSISVQNLLQLAHFYNVPISYFFEVTPVTPAKELQLLLNGTSEEFQRFILSNMKHLIKTSKEFISGN